MLWVRNPAAINLWDINAKLGHPSQGLMQVIPGKFAAYAGSLGSLGILNPLANIFAGLNYALHRYGSITAIDPLIRPYGYDQGGVLKPGLTLAYNGTGKPETIRTHEQERALGERSVVVFVENPWTGEYLQAKMRQEAQTEIAGQVRMALNGRR
ncbi:MAG: lytic transglycosylase domain-containing protein [Mycobacteriaceae bacterium]